MMQQSEPFTGQLSSDKQQILDVIGHNFDVVYKEFVIKIEGMHLQAALIYVSVLVDQDYIHTNILTPLSIAERGSIPTDFDSIKRNIINRLESSCLSVTLYVSEAIRRVLSGDTVLLMEGLNESFLFPTAKSPARQVEEPVSEMLVRGSREGFVEQLDYNISLLRRRIKDPSFTMHKYEVGRRSKTAVVVAFISNIANQEIVDEVNRRIKRIDIDEIAESGTIEQLIEDHHFTPFPQMLNTERPDKVASFLMQGMVAVITDGTPFVLLVPVTLSMMLQSPEDYYGRWWISSLLRVLRYIITFFSLYLPSIYIALVSYQQGLIPTKLAISITSSREGVPFPTFVEALIMEMTIEILREAGLRLPKPIGQAVGIVGGLVIGQSAVEAGIVSPIMVIVVALTAISSFAIPFYDLGITFRMLRFGFMIAAAVFGLYGLIMASLLLIGHLARLKSFGVDFADTSLILRPKLWKDTIFRLPLHLLKQRSVFTKAIDRTRLNSPNLSRPRKGGTK